MTGLGEDEVTPTGEGRKTRASPAPSPSAGTPWPQDRALPRPLSAQTPAHEPLWTPGGVALLPHFALSWTGHLGTQRCVLLTAAPSCSEGAGAMRDHTAAGELGQSLPCSGPQFAASETPPLGGTEWAEHLRAGPAGAPGRAGGPDPSPLPAGHHQPDLHRVGRGGHVSPSGFAAWGFGLGLRGLA